MSASGEDAADPMHVDFIVNDWSNHRQIRVGWVDVAYAESVRAFSPWGSYAFRSDPHRRSECPWNEYPDQIIPMIEGDLSELVIPDDNDRCPSCDTSIPGPSHPLERCRHPWHEASQARQSGRDAG